MSTVQAVVNNETMFKNSSIKTQHPMNSYINGFNQSDPIIKSNKIYAKNLEEQFKAACETIQSLPKNGMF